jgi:hypothetical protein
MASIREIMEVRELADTRTVSIVVSNDDYKVLQELARRGHSYPATVARGLLSEKIAEKRREISNAEAV